MSLQNCKSELEELRDILKTHCSKMDQLELKFNCYSVLSSKWGKDTEILIVKDRREDCLFTKYSSSILAANQREGPDSKAFTISPQRTESEMVIIKQCSGYAA